MGGIDQIQQELDQIEIHLPQGHYDGKGQKERPGMTIPIWGACYLQQGRRTRGKGTATVNRRAQRVLPLPGQCSHNGKRHIGCAGEE